MRRRDLRLVPFAVGAWAAALLGVLVSGAAFPVALSCLVVAALVLVAATVRARAWGDSVSVPLASGVLVGVLLVASAVSFAVVIAGADRDVAVGHGGAVVETEGVIVSSASVGTDGRLWVDVDARSFGRVGAPAALRIPVRIGIPQQAGVDLGAVVRVQGQAKVTDPGERAAVVVFASEVGIVGPAEGVFAVAASVRETFVERSLRLPEPGAALLPGLAVGDTRAVGADLDDAMRLSGLSHLTAVSGANCAIVVGAVFWVAALCGAGRRLRIGCAAIALASFVVLVTPEPSVVRAAVMATVAMLALLLGRPSAGVGLLSLCAVVILAVDPWLATSPGFALSVAASGGLILLAPSLARGIERFAPAPIALALSVPLAAQLVCAPIIALFAERQSLIGVAANLLAAPAAPLATVIGLLACLAAPLPPLADLFAASAWLPAAWIAKTAEVCAGLPLASVPLAPGIGSAALMAAAGMAIGMLTVRPRAGPSSPARRVARAVIGICVAAVLGLGAGQWMVGAPLAPLRTPQDWVMAACDVGQGDAVLFRSQGRVMLIDTGPEPDALTRCLNEFAIDRIDVLVLTHFDLDHVGGVAAVEGRVDQVLHGPASGTEDAAVLEGLAAAGATNSLAASGLEGTLGAARWRVLWPEARSTVFPEGNDGSVVLDVSGPDVPRTLLLGDLSAAAQRLLLRRAPVRGPYEVVKVAHHGSADQDPGLYAEARAAVAVIPVGEDNDYGHPRDETLDLLAGLGYRVFRTDIDGTIMVARSEDAIAIRTARSAAP